MNDFIKKADVVICGAGIAGISAAYHLAVRRGIRDVLLVDERPPLSLTSDKSTECYRNWWPGPGNAMVALMNRSIDLLEELADESGNRFSLNRRGYLYLTADTRKLEEFIRAAQDPALLGAGPLRIYRAVPDDPQYHPSLETGYRNMPDGADLFLDSGLIQKKFPYLSENSCAALHVRRAGWLSAQQLGRYLLEMALEHGVQLVNTRLVKVDVTGGQVSAVRFADGSRIETGCFVNAAGPMLKEVGGMLGVDLPVYSELHLKVAFRDHLGIVPRQAPLLIWNDPQRLLWSPEERGMLAEDPHLAWLLDEMPAGAHTRPEGGMDSDAILLLWEYHVEKAEPVFPVPLDDRYAEIALRGMAAMLPGFQRYFDRMPRPSLDGGYYIRTIENRPLIGPLPVSGSYVIGALSGFGVMAACAAGELLAAHLTSGELPLYASDFSLDRYQNPHYRRLLENWGSTGQL